MKPASMHTSTYKLNNLMKPKNNFNYSEIEQQLLSIEKNHHSEPMRSSRPEMMNLH